jgi:uncharacterized protein YaaN involved in tellurite resistance
MEEIKLNFGDGNESQTPNEALSSLEKMKDEEPAGLSLKSLTPEEQNQILEFVSKINVTDSNSIISYGAGAQTKIAKFADDTLKNVKTKDSGEAGKLLSDLVVTIKNFDSVGENKGFLGNLFGKVKNEVDKLVARYNDVEVNIDKITSLLQNHRHTMLKDIAMYDEMYKMNLIYLKELSMYIVAGKEKIKELNESVIPAMKEKAIQSGDEADAQKLNDLINSVNRFEKKVHDLQLSRQISLQMAPQIRLIQNNDAQLADKIQSSIVNSIPLWKNQMVISLGLANAKAALESQKKVTDMTNELLKKNSEMLKTGTIEIAKESERGIVSIETIKKTNQDLIETITGVIEIQRKGKEDRLVAESEIAQIENELKQTLLGIKN